MEGDITSTKKAVSQYSSLTYQSPPLTTAVLAYIYPNDEPENDRLDLQHKLFAQLHGGRIFFAPMRNPKRILDVGTGTGLWAIDMGM
jgi:hypothetical protein